VLCETIFIADTRVFGAALFLLSESDYRTLALSIWSQKGHFNFVVMLALQQLKKLSEEGVKPINLIEYEEGLRV
jgi:hypothetical protein